MRKITIYQKGSANVEILDDSDVNIDEYCQELSKLFQLSNVVILNTSESTFIGRPSQLTGISVEELDLYDENLQEQMLAIPEETEEPTKDVVEESQPAEEIHEDIITDVD